HSNCVSFHPVPAAVSTKEAGGSGRTVSRPLLLSVRVVKLSISVHEAGTGRERKLLLRRNVPRFHRTHRLAGSYPTRSLSARLRICGLVHPDRLAGSDHVKGLVSAQKSIMPCRVHHSHGSVPVRLLEETLKLVIPVH